LLFISLFLLILFPPLTLLSKELLIKEKNSLINLTYYYEYKIDKTNKIDIKDLIEKKASNFTLLKGKTNLGFLPYPVWLKFSIINQSKEENLGIIFDYPNIDFIDFYLLNNKKQIIKSVKTGILRDIRTRESLFPKTEK